MNIIIVDDDCLVSGALKTILEVNGDIRVCLLYTSDAADD